MNQYTYITTAYGPAKTHASLNDAVEWSVEYLMTDKARCFSPQLWIIDEKGDMIGDIYFSGKDCKIMIGNNSPLVIDACSMLRNAVVAQHCLIA